MLLWGTNVAEERFDDPYKAYLINPPANDGKIGLRLT